MTASWRVDEGDCVAVMAAMPGASVDAIVTDPPYGLGFMGKAWDDLPPGVEWARECLRVLRPGGHMVAFGGTRTFHRLACAIEDAGFEIRDTLAWMYGQGFPKSLDVSKAIDKAAGAEREVVKANPNHRPISGVEYEGIYSGGNTGAATITAPATPDAERWQGWGTALKPAFEPVVLARKPFSGSVAGNVLEHGTGAINVDGCRIAGGECPVIVRTGTVVAASSMSGESTGATASGETTTLGRWPANVVMDEDAAAELDAQTGMKVGGHSVGPRPTSYSHETLYAGGVGKDRTPFDYGDSGGASRFFYCAKASSAERGSGNTHPTVKPVELMRWLCRLITPPGGTILDPFTGSGTTGIAALRENFQFIGIEREPEYAAIARARIVGDAPLLNTPLPPPPPVLSDVVPGDIGTSPRQFDIFDVLADAEDEAA